jgi:hypothetical protein
MSICIPIPSDLDRLSNYGRARTKFSYAHRFLLRFSLACTSCANVRIEGGKAGALMAMSWVPIRSSLFPSSRPPRQGHSNPSSSFRIIETSSIVHIHSIQLQAHNGSCQGACSRLLHRLTLVQSHHFRRSSWPQRCRGFSIELHNNPLAARRRLLLAPDATWRIHHEGRSRGS